MQPSRRDRVVRGAGLLAGLTLLVGAGCRFVGPGEDPDFPWDYREFALVSTRTSTEAADPHPGFLLVFASEETAEASRRRGPYPEGSALVAVGYDAAADAGAVRPDERRTVWLMRKRGDAWSFSTFGGETLKKERTDEAACASCHQKAAETDHVYTRWLD